MEIDYTAELLKVKVIPSQDGFIDIVKEVEWKIKFYDIDHEDNVWTNAHVHSVLNTDSLDSFITWDNITQQQILQFALENEGGTEFLDHLLAGGHAARLQAQKDNLSYVEKDIPLIPLT